jgi:hypothetical protein
VKLRHRADTSKVCSQFNGGRDFLFMMNIQKRRES